MADSTQTTTNGFDAEADSRSRSLLVFPTNSRKEHRPLTRRRLQEKARALEANYPIFTRIKRKFARRVAGKGIFPVPVTKDPEWNGLALEVFERWAFNPQVYSIDGSRDLCLDQRLAAGELGGGDGEYFAAKVLADGAPFIQPLDPFEIETPYGSGAAGLNPGLFEDGVMPDLFLRPMAFAVRELPALAQYYQPKWREVPAAAMIHGFRRRRAKQFRGIPPIYSGINTGNDSLDTLALEQASAKLHSLLAAVATRKPGNKGGGLTKQLETVLKDSRTDYVQEKFKGGAVTLELEENESLQLLTSGRPSAPAIEGLKFGAALIALGVDLPLSVVWSFMGMGGTPTRADLEDAQETFEIDQDHLVWTHSHPIYVWRLAVAMATGELRQCKDPYWWKSDWHGPAKMTVDYGRSAQANIDLMKAGMLAIPRYCEERGWDWQAEQDKQIAWLKRAQERCAAEGVDFDRFFEATPGAVQQAPVKDANAAKKPAKPGDDEETEDEDE